MLAPNRNQFNNVKHDLSNEPTKAEVTRFLQRRAAAVSRAKRKAPPVTLAGFKSFHDND